MERFNNRFANILLTDNEISNLVDRTPYNDDSELESLSDSDLESIATLSDSFTNESNTISNQIQHYINQIMESRYNNEYFEALNTEFLNSYPGDSYPGDNIHGDNIHGDNQIQNFINNSFNENSVIDDSPSSTEVLDKYDSLNTIKNDKEDTCSICLDEIKINKKIYNLSCNHKFHKKCLKNWLKEKFSCPTCRIEI